ATPPPPGPAAARRPSPPILSVDPRTPPSAAPLESPWALRGASAGPCAGRGEARRIGRFEGRRRTVRGRPVTLPETSMHDGGLGRLLALRGVVRGLRSGEQQRLQRRLLVHPPQVLLLLRPPAEERQHAQQGGAGPEQGDRRGQGDGPVAPLQRLPPRPLL